MKVVERNIYQIYPLGAVGAPFENDFKLEHRILQLISPEWLKHYKKLRVNTILLNPVFQSTSHGYNTIDFHTVDQRLGTVEDLQLVCQTLHNQDLHVLFDGVFNHVGRDFLQFQDVLKRRRLSEYKDWFMIDFDGNNSYDDHLRYENWEGHDELVRLNLKNPKVREFIFDVIDEWIDLYHIDGLRLDVAYCLDQDFLRYLHHHVKQKNRHFFLLGETLHGDYNQWMNNNMLDSVTNYECYKGLHSSFNTRNFFEIMYSFNRQFGKEPWCLYTGKHPLSFVDNHDVNRIASILEKKEWLPLIYAMLYAMPGIPSVYYGSEWGIEGVKNYNDTSLRPYIEKPEWNELCDLISVLNRMRHLHLELVYGDYTQIALSNLYCIFERAYQGKAIWACFNIKDEPMDIPVNSTKDGINLFTDEVEKIPGFVHMEPNSFKFIFFRYF